MGKGSRRPYKLPPLGKLIQIGKVAARRRSKRHGSTTFYATGNSSFSLDSFGPNRMNYLQNGTVLKTTQSKAECEATCEAVCLAKVFSTEMYANNVVVWDETKQAFVINSTKDNGGHLRGRADGSAAPRYSSFRHGSDNKLALRGALTALEIRDNSSLAVVGANLLEQLGAGDIEYYEHSADYSDCYQEETRHCKFSASVYAIGSKPGPSSAYASHNPLDSPSPPNGNKYNFQKFTNDAGTNPAYDTVGEQDGTGKDNISDAKGGLKTNGLQPFVKSSDLPKLVESFSNPENFDFGVPGVKTPENNVDN